MSVRVGWKQRALVFSVKLSNANPVNTWIGERLTLPSTADFSCFFVFFFVVFPAYSLSFVVILSLIAIILFPCALQTPFPKDDSDISFPSVCISVYTFFSIYY